jgi:hypothetical protein
MEIYISEEAIISNIQQDFQEVYSFLRLEFYNADGKIPCDTPIEDIRMMHTFGWIDISKYRSAAEVEYDFRHLLGLSVQIMRKSGDLWVQTNRTDFWTLSQLNEEGRLARHHMFFYPGEPAE